MDMYSALNISAVVETSKCSLSSKKFSYGTETPIFFVSSGTQFSVTKKSTCEGFYEEETSSFAASPRISI